MKGLELERGEEETDREGIERHERAGTERSQGREEEPGALSAQGQKLFLDDHTRTHRHARANARTHAGAHPVSAPSLLVMYVTRRRPRRLADINVAPARKYRWEKKREKKRKNNPKQPHLRK